MSSFRPASNAKLYASPEDVKTVGYRSRSLPSHSSRPHVRKSQSMRSGASSFKPANAPSPNNVTSPTKPVQSNSNPYAQPFKTMRSHSSAGTIHRKKRNSVSSSISASSLSSNNTVGNGAPPPIPEPDYSLSESDGAEESESDIAAKKELDIGASRVTINNNPPAETSGNSNTR